MIYRSKRSVGEGRQSVIMNLMKVVDESLLEVREFLDEAENFEEEEENTEETEEETEVDPMYRDYEILSDFYKKHFVDLRVLDSSCEPSRVPPPKVEIV